MFEATKWFGNIQRFSLLVLLCAVATKAQTAPNITSVGPQQGPVGTAVTITGTSFGATQGTSTITFGGVAATSITTWNETQIVAAVPSGAPAGPVTIYVTTSAGTSNGVAFRVGPYPTITGVSPMQGPAGTSVTITGVRFGATQGSSTVTFAGVAATAISTWTDTQIVAQVPSGAPTGATNIYVTTSAGSSNGVYFRVGTYPAISNTSPTQGPTGTFVTINGTSFGATQGSSSVTFAGVAATNITTWTDTQIVAQIPSAAPNGATNIYVTTAVGSSNGVYFRIGIYPLISSISPQAGPVGTSVTINGQNFGASQVSGSTVTFGGVTATTITTWTDTKIVALVPPGAPTTSNIYVSTTANGSSNGVYFNVTGPSITSLTPVYGPVGTAVTIAGANFGTTQGTSTVKFNGTAATLAGTWSTTSIPVTVPSGATTGNVVVNVGGTDSNGMPFAVSNLPYGWADSDIGTVALAGSASFASSGTFTVKGAGCGVQNCGNGNATTDGLNFMYQSLSGDGSIVARVLSQPTQYAIAGVMIRESLNSNSTNAFVYYRPTASGNNIYLSDRTSTGSATNDSIASFLNISLPYWLKLVRSGTSFTAYQSLDGVNWIQMGSIVTISMAQNVYVGLATSIYNNSALATATFDSVSVSPTTAPAPAITGVSATSGSVGSQVTITGSGFGSIQSSSVVLLNGAPVTINSWTSTSVGITIPTGATSGPLEVLVSPSMNASNPVTFTVTSNPLPSGWLDRDIGYVPPPGSATYASGIFTVKGAGCSFTNCGNGNNTTDAFHFVYQPLSGDGTIVARVVSLSGSSPMAGVLFRETLDTASAYEMLAFTPPNSGFLQVWSRSSTSAVASNVAQVQFISLPYWVKITRTGSILTAYTSTQGVNWVQLGTYQWSSMQSNLYVGLGASSGVNGTTSTATFDNVSVSSAASPAPSITTVSATTGPVGTAVTITGTGFGTTQGSSFVLLNGTAVTINSWSATSVAITIPSGATSGSLAVTVAPSMDTSNPVVFTVTSQPLLSGWLDQDVGGVGIAGSATVSGSVFTVKGAGTGVNSTSDGFHFVFQPLTTNGTLVARVASVGTSWGSQAGVMIRESMDAGSANVFNYVQFQSPSYFKQFGARTLLGGGTTQTTAVAVSVPYWVKLVRNANTFTAYVSPDGSSWTQIGASQAFTTVQTVYIGMAVSSATTSTLATATFDNVSLTIGSSLPNPVITGISKTSGAPGTSVTITGSGFGSTQGSGSTANFNGTVAAITSWNDTQIVATVPLAASTGPVTVQEGNITATGPLFTISMTARVTDSLGNPSSYVSQVFGNEWRPLTFQGSGCSTCSDRANLQLQYDQNGNTLSTIDALGNKTKNAFDTSNNLTSTSVPINSTTSATTTYTYNSFGEVLTATDPLGHVTTNSYDSKGNLLTVTTPSPDGTLPGSVTTFTYNTLGELTTITDPLNHVTTLTYTPVGLISTITDAQNNVTTYGYDSHGNRTSVQDALNHTTTFTYDTGDRLTKITYPDTTTTQFAYDYRGRRTSVTDQNGKVTTYAYDDADRLTSVTDAANNITTYAYDTESNLAGITDANNHTTNFTYDAFGRVTQTTFPSTLFETYGYDANNNLTSKTDRKNQRITYSYDQSNRLTQKSYPDSTSVNYTYDNASRLTQVTDPTGTYQFTFDNMGRLTGTTTQYSFVARNFTTGYAYDKASNRTGFTDPENGSTTYAYDTLNRLQTLTPPSAFTAGNFGFSYDALSRRTQMTRPNNVATNYGYDNLSRLTNILHQLSGSTIDGATYTVDNAGNRTAKTDQRTAVATNYGYDAIYQLLSATQGGSTTESYTYDPVGNRTASLGVASYTTNTSNELTATSNASYTYDNNGNTLTKVVGSNTTTYAWDYENRLTSVALPASGGTVTFAYDPFGRRIKKVVSSTSTTSIFAYDGDNMVEETNSSGAAVARYSQGLNIDEPLAMLRSSATSYYNADGLGTVTSLANTSGTLAQTYTFDSFGKQTASSGSLTNPFQYTARESDLETGLYYYRARYYDPSTGRFIREDPIGFSGDINVYRYSFNSPTNLDDPSGLTATGTPGLPGFCKKDYEDCVKKVFGKTSGNVPGSDRSIPGYEAALDVFQASLLVGADAPTVAITLAFESNSNLYPVTNLNRNGSIDIGPMQLNTDAANNGAFPNIFPGSLTDAQGSFPAPHSAFNGNPLSNIMTGALYLRSLRGHPERYAAPIYRPSRADSLKKLDGAFRKLFDCLKSASLPQ